MTSHCRTLIPLRGSAGTGKTALAQAMLRGQTHLVGLPLLQDAIGRGFAIFDLATINALLDDQQPLLPTIQRLLGEKPYLLSDACVNTAQEVAECAGHYRVVVLWLFARPHLVEARRRVRYGYYTADPTREQLAGVLPDETLLEQVERCWRDLPGVEMCFVDASDFPLREVTLAEVLAMLADDRREPELLPVDEMYQQALWIGGECYGTQDAARREWERARLDSILPADLTGKTLLDIGASEGGMCYEAIHRGAIHATAVEMREPQIMLMRHIRDCRHLPLTTCRMDIVSESLPRLNAHEEVLRYDVGLLLNVLHHCDDPGAVLGKVLDACNSVIAETPFWIGEAPYKPGLPPYPNATHLPPAWVQSVGRAHGFALASIEVSDMCPGQRLIYRLERYDG